MSLFIVERLPSSESDIIKVQLTGRSVAGVPNCEEPLRGSVSMLPLLCRPTICKSTVISDRGYK